MRKRGIAYAIAGLVAFALMGLSAAPPAMAAACPALPCGKAPTQKAEGSHCPEAMRNDVQARLDGALMAVAAARKAVEAGDTAAATEALARAEAVLAGLKKTVGHHGPQAGKVINDRCPMMGGRVNPEKVTPALTRTHRGKTVGFCCAGCPGKWDKLSDAQKDAKLKDLSATP